MTKVQPDIEGIAHLLAGTEPGWQTRFGKMLGLSRGHVSNLLTGKRELTLSVLSKILATAEQEASLFRERANRLEKIAELIRPGLTDPKIENPPYEE